MIECFWYILASALAGVGTGLVGLPVATVTAPLVNAVILIGALSVRIAESIKRWINHQLAFHTIHRNI